MTLTTHLSVGAAIGTATGNPALGFFAGLVSHFAMDALPHFDAGSLGGDSDNIFKNRKASIFVSIDIFLGIFLIIILFCRNNNLGIFWPILGATLPDIIDDSPFWSKYIRKVFPLNYLHKIHEKVQFTVTVKKNFWLGILTQLILIAASLIYIFSHL